MSSREFSEWLAFYALDPFGEERADLRAGIVASTVANVNRDPRRQPSPFRPGDFMPRFEDDMPRERDPAEMYQQIRTWAILAGARPGERSNG